MNTIALVIIAYALGSLPFAVIVSRAMRLSDPRNYGSGNPGATNVLRSGNKFAALLTLIGDAAKGWFAVWLAKHLGFAPTDIALTGFAVFLGHVYSMLLRFKGGKGVATAAGVLFGFSPWLGLGVIIVWSLIAWLSRYSSLAAVATAAVAPILSLVLLRTIEPCIAVLCISTLLVWRHKDNLQRLFAGKEGRIGEKRLLTPDQSAGNKV